MKKPAYRHYLLTLLAVILAFNYVDRTILGLARRTSRRISH